MSRSTGLLAFTLLAGSAFADKPITITFLHSNDLHAHIEPTVIRKVSYGGYARQATLIKRFRARDKNVLLLNAGDTFQGTRDVLARRPAFGLAAWSLWKALSPLQKQ